MSRETKIDLILARLKIDVLERKGNRCWARCPYADKHHKRGIDIKPSWFIRPAGDRAGEHHCFTCKNGGALWELVKFRLGFGTDEAAKEWVRDFIVEESKPLHAPQSIRVELAGSTAKGFRLPSECIFKPLYEWVGPMADYATKRGLTPRQVVRWSIGYALHGKLAGRIVIPVFAKPHQPANYMARAIDGQEPKYLHAHAKEHPDLDALFGQLYWPGPGVHTKTRVYVVEGALNALAIERALQWMGETSWIAAIGSSNMRPLHIAAIGRFDEVMVVTDSDKAGDDVAYEYLFALSRHTSVHRVRLPEGEDADSLSRGDLVQWLKAKPKPFLESSF